MCLSCAGTSRQCLIVRRQRLQTAVFFLQSGLPRLGDEVAAPAALHLRLRNVARLQKALQQVVKGAWSHRHPASGQLCYPGHDVGAALLLPQTQQDIKHLLRQGLEFFPGHDTTSNIEYRYL